MAAESSDGAQASTLGRILLVAIGTAVAVVIIATAVKQLLDVLQPTATPTVTLLPTSKPTATHPPVITLEITTKPPPPSPIPSPETLTPTPMPTATPTGTPTYTETPTGTTTPTAVAAIAIPWPPPPTLPPTNLCDPSWQYIDTPEHGSRLPYGRETLVIEGTAAFPERFDKYEIWIRPPKEAGYKAEYQEVSQQVVRGVLYRWSFESWTQQYGSGWYYIRIRVVLIGGNAPVGGQDGCHVAVFLPEPN